MCTCVYLLLLAALPALAGVGSVGGEVVSVTEGAGPAFAMRQRTTFVAALGQDATLECRVLRLGDKSVSWVRSRDLQILSHAGIVFTADARVAASAAGGRHALHIRRLRASDAGRYECQVNTEPKMSLFFNLTVVDEPVPDTVVRVLGEQEQSSASGSAVTLACEARYEPAPRALPVPPLQIQWQKDGQLLDLQSNRGGVSLDTERWPSRVVSRLTLAALASVDAGQYQCSVGVHSASVHLRIIDEQAGSQMEAMQRDESESLHNSTTHSSTALARRSLMALGLLVALVSLAFYNT